VVAVFAVVAGAQTLPLEDKARFEKALEEKVEAVLQQMLGPNQAKVVVEATIDFTRLERVDVRSAELESATKEKARTSLFLWQNLQDEQNRRPQLLPGFPIPEAPGQMGGPLSGTNQKYERQLSYPEAFLKRLAVTLLLSRSLSEEQAENIRGVVQDLLGMKPERGDTLNVVRADFPPPWKTVWYSTETAGSVVKYAAMTVMGILALLVLAVCFLKLAGAMSAMARVQMHQVQMELPKVAGAPGPGAAAGVPELEGERREALAGGEEGPSEELTFDVRLEQVDTLVHIIGREEPANIALVVAHLRPEVKRAFLARIPAETTAAVLEQLARVRFVDPEMIAGLKEELERRLKGALGGPRRVLELLEQTDLKTKKELLEQLFKRNTELAREVRRQVLLLEDMVRLEPKDLAVFVTSARLDDWAVALCDAPEPLRQAVRSQLPERSWKIVEQTMAARRPTEEKIQEAQEKLLATARKLIAEGRIANPLASLPELLTAAEQAKGPTEAAAKETLPQELGGGKG